MRYYDAYRMTGDNGVKWLFTRCGECGSVVAEVDQETHTEWHESGQRRVEQLRQMYKFAIDDQVGAMRERLTRAYDAQAQEPRDGWKNAWDEGDSDG